MATEVDICNRALQKLGAKLISSFNEDSKNAREVRACYSSLLESELRTHTWNFAVKRASLAADAATPAWGRANSFQLPSDFLRLLSPYPEMNLNCLDYVIEGRSVLTNDSAPLDVRYVAKVTDPSTMDANFREAFATKMAYELCEAITQSNTKKEALRQDYKDIIQEARRTNGIEIVPAVTPPDEWLTVRA